MINASEYRAMELRNTIALPACAGHLIPANDISAISRSALPPDAH